ncbi:formin-like protein 3 [Ptychodera flava]|uniref:formin-like protein 3 n=1 Tax=Ptychodera flava TaxID=63121 RepID=UPI00396A78B8
MTDREIKEAITKCDISENGVPGEIAELLLKFLPTREELRGLAKNADKYELMADAEKFMFKMARIDRYESRLKLMAFMGIYDDLIKTVSPQIDGVLRASVSVIESKKLRKLFEISDTKNTKRTYSLLHYIVKTILVYYPNVAEWYHDIDVNAAIGVSLESISTDIHGLRKGMELARYEKEKQEENMIVSISFTKTYKQNKPIIQG